MVTTDPFGARIVNEATSHSEAREWQRLYHSQGLGPIPACTAEGRAMGDPALITGVGKAKQRTDSGVLNFLLYGCRGGTEMGPQFRPENGREQS